jgi:plasmid stabilization system protein ParE
MAKRPPRGIRNHNPGNIRRSGIRWKNMAAQQSDPDFVQFTAPVHGIRAMAKILLTYHRRGFRSLEQIIQRWAPSSENDTAAYVAAIARAVERPSDKPYSCVELLEQDALERLIAAMIRHENGVQPYDAALIARAVTLAL